MLPKAVRKSAIVSDVISFLVVFRMAENMTKVRIMIPAPSRDSKQLMMDNATRPRLSSLSSMLVSVLLPTSVVLLAIAILCSRYLT